MDWFRWYHGCVTDTKLALVAKRAGASVAEVVAVWAFVLERASQAQPRGDIAGIDLEALDLFLGMSDGKANSIMDHLCDRGLIVGGVVASWAKRQPQREDMAAAERKRRQREKDAAMSRTVTQCHALSRNVTLEEKRIDKKDQEQKHGQTEPRALHAGGRFDDFWRVYPNKKGRATAERAWARKKLDSVADQIIADVRQRIDSDRDWLRGYIPHGSTYVNGEGWRDGLPSAPAPTQSRQMQGLQNLYNAFRTDTNDESNPRLVFDADP